MHFELYRLGAYPHVFLTQEALEVFIDPNPDPFGMCYNAEPSRRAIGNMDYISKQIKDRKIVFNYHHCFFLSKFPDYPGCLYPLVDVKVRAYLINKIKISFLCHACRKRHPLKLAATQFFYLMVQDVLNIKP